MQPPAKKQKTRKSRKHVASFAEDNIPEDTIFKTPVSPPHPQPSATRRHAPAAAEPQLMDSFDTSHNMPAKMKRRTKEASPTDQAGPQPATASQAPDPASSLNISSSELKDKKEVPKTRRGRTKKSEKPCCEEKDNIAVVKEEPRIEILPDYKHPSNRYHRTISLTCGEFAVTGMDTEAFCKRIQRALEMVTAEGYGIRGLKQHVLDAIFKE
ncbi:hypothetical protein BC830DRAFT_1097156 [Chytriomyces sp. MP71]|nr:hypothetical protein BC830DRAFT_1097156 [Chytriomyces sp. MP71]